MNDAVTPRVVSLLCRVRRADQAKAAGLTVRHLRRLAESSSWDRWRIGNATAWCRACGFDLRDLRLTPEAASRVRWDAADDRTLKALRDIYSALFPKVKPTKSRLIRCGATVQAGIETACGHQG